MDKKKFQLLISTMEQYDTGLLETMNVCAPAVIINQVHCPKQVNMDGIRSDILWINKDERGLSKSRNMAMEASESEICLFADDDEVFCSDIEKTIVSAFEKIKDAGLIAFQVHGIEKRFKKYASSQKKLNFFSALKISSVQIAFRKHSIEKKGIKMDERFGAGSKYIMGEENIFLSDCLRQGLKMYYVPSKIADLHMNKSSWNNGYDEKYFVSRGAQYFRMSKCFYPVLIFYFSTHIYMRHKGQFKLKDALKWMFKGAKECKKQ